MNLTYKRESAGKLNGWTGGREADWLVATVARTK